MDDEPKLGSPWSILPIKNNKYARDLSEVHLNGKLLTGLEHFEQFPNLEEIWLSNNKVSSFNFETKFRFIAPKPRRHRIKFPLQKSCLPEQFD